MLRDSWKRKVLTGGVLALLAFGGALFGLRLVIKSGEVTVPPLEGQNIVVALEELNRLNLRLEIESQEYNPRVPGNHIVSQRPGRGDTIKRGRKVRVVLSKGPRLVNAPPLAGKSWYKAQTALRRAGLVAGKVLKIYNPMAAQQVIAQYPAAGRALQQSGEVALLLSKGPEPDSYLMPDFIGRQLEDARRRLRIMGFTAGEIREGKYQGVAAGVIINQSPPAGYRVREGEAVDFVVSAG